MSLVREHLLHIYRAALVSVHGESRTWHALVNHNYGQPVTVIAIGKAASSMMLGAVAALGDALDAGILITKDGHVDERLQDIKNIRCLESAHPVPDQRSLYAGDALLEFVAQEPAQNDFLFLISGGASSLVDVLPEGLLLDDLQRVNQWLLASGWNIAAMNRVRKSLSCIKGGRLAQRLTGRNTHCLMISDVPDNSPQVIGSGFLSPGIPPKLLPVELPEWIKMLPTAPSPPLFDDPCFDGIDIKVIASLDDAMRAAKSAAVNLGYRVCLHTDFITGNAQNAGQKLAHTLSAGDSVLHIWGGETTVDLPDVPGCGGRNQHLALAVAIELAGTSGQYFLAAGTDGSDGPTQAAGALVDGQTLQRGSDAGFDGKRALVDANAGEFLQASGDLIITGPTGTNVMDLMLGIKLPAT